MEFGYCNCVLPCNFCWVMEQTGSGPPPCWCGPSTGGPVPEPSPPGPLEVQEGVGAAGQGRATPCWWCAPRPSPGRGSGGTKMCRQLSFTVGLVMFTSACLHSRRDTLCRLFSQA